MSSGQYSHILCYHIKLIEASYRIHSDDKANDYLNYVRERAAHAKKSHIDVLYDLGDEVVESQDKVDACLAGTGPAEEYWKTLKNGIMYVLPYSALHESENAHAVSSF